MWRSSLRKSDILSQKIKSFFSQNVVNFFTEDLEILSNRRKSWEDLTIFSHKILRSSHRISEDFSQKITRFSLKRSGDFLSEKRYFHIRSSLRRFQLNFSQSENCSLKDLVIFSQDFLIKKLKIFSQNYEDLKRSGDLFKKRLRIYS